MGVSKDDREKAGLFDVKKTQIYATRDRNRANILIGRSGSSEDIAKVIAFLTDREQNEFVVGVK